ncbi:MAG TPA: hypothetical protein VE135_02040, partial [Pyrinomonadaceae bacterium]|nr:hypothetical protein [Pyrinomonadaceae bacterium]
LSLSVTHCLLTLRRESTREPDAGNPHVRFEEGRVGRILSPSLLLYWIFILAEMGLDPLNHTKRNG